MGKDADVVNLAIEYARNNPRATFREADAFAVAMQPFFEADAHAWDRDVAAQRSKILRKRSRSRLKEQREAK